MSPGGQQVGDERRQSKERGADNAAVAQAYSQNGAKVFISGRRKEVLDKAVQEIKAAGGKTDVIP